MLNRNRSKHTLLFKMNNVVRQNRIHPGPWLGKIYIYQVKFTYFCRAKSSLLMLNCGNYLIKNWNLLQRKRE
jgi:hypothetical protein